MTASRDTSTRFVLADDCAVPKEHGGALDDRSGVGRGDRGDRRTVFVSRGAIALGPANGFRSDAGGRTLYLHSRYDPAAEAAEAERIDRCGNTSRVLVFGLRPGYHVEELFGRSSDESLFIVFEPDLLLLRTAFESRDLSAMIESGRLLFFTRLDKGELLTRFTPQSALISIGVSRSCIPPSQQIAGTFHKQMRLWIDEFASFSHTSINTVVLNSRRTAENIARNIGWYAAAPSLARLQNRHAGKPAIIVSAGPSLRKNKHLLKDFPGSSHPSRCRRCLQPLLEMGVEPQFVTSLDYQEICTRFFEKLPESLATEMVAEPKANSANPVDVSRRRFRCWAIRSPRVCCARCVLANRNCPAGRPWRIWRTTWRSISAAIRSFSSVRIWVSATASATRRAPATKTLAAGTFAILKRWK